MDKLIVFRRVYEYLFWLRPTVERFAKAHKYSLGIEMQSQAMDLLKLVIRANYASFKDEDIAEALVTCEVERVYVRLAFEYRLLSPRQFAFAAEKLEEIGRLLRGWKNSENGKTANSPA